MRVTISNNYLTNVASFSGDKLVLETRLKAEHLFCSNEARLVENINKSQLMLAYFDVTSLLKL